MLAEQTPALFRAFDLLAEGKAKLMKAPFSERRDALEELIAAAPGRKKSALGLGRADAADEDREDRRALAAFAARA